MPTNRYSTQFIDESDIESVVRALKSDVLTGGKFVEQFEKDLADYCGSRYAVVFANATAALHASYAVLDLPKNSEVIVPAITFAATSNAAIYAGYKPVFADIDYSTGLISIDKIESLIGKQTRIIAPVHYAGNICDMEAISRIAKKHDLVVIEDAAHAIGSRDKSSKMAGTFGTMGIYSFHPVKPITTGEGGAVVTDDEELAHKLKAFRSHGIVRGKLWSQDMLTLGYNYRLSDINASLGVSQLKKLDRFIDRRNEIANIYDEEFAGSLIYPLKKNPLIRSSYHLYAVLLDRSLWCAKEDIFAKLADQGIGAQVHYKPVYSHTYYKQNYPDRASLANSEDFYRAELSIPCHHHLSDQQAREIAHTIKETTKSLVCGF